MRPLFFAIMRRAAGGKVEVYISSNAFWALLISAIEVYKRECFGLLLGYRDTNNYIVEHAISYQTANRRHTSVERGSHPLPAAQRHHPGLRSIGDRNMAAEPNRPAARQREIDPRHAGADVHIDCARGLRLPAEEAPRVGSCSRAGPLATRRAGRTPRVPGGSGRLTLGRGVLFWVG